VTRRDDSQSRTNSRVVFLQLSASKNEYHDHDRSSKVSRKTWTRLCTNKHRACSLFYADIAISIWTISAFGFRFVVIALYKRKCDDVHQGYEVRDITDGQPYRPCSVPSSSSDERVLIVMSYEVLPWQSCGARPMFRFPLQDCVGDRLGAALTSRRSRFNWYL